jgi:hypothetical protein
VNLSLARVLDLSFENYLGRLQVRVLPQALTIGCNVFSNFAASDLTVDFDSNSKNEKK